jgi:outer membrane PBP1 activator LpoA protein
MDVPSLRPLALLLLVGLTVAGCGTTPVTPSQPVQQAPRAEAEAALAGGDSAEAARILEAAAARTGSPERERLLLQAADLRLDLEQTAAAADLLLQISFADLLPPEQFQYRLLQARVLLAQAHPEAAAQQLQGLGEPPAELYLDWLQIRAQVLAETDQHLAAAEARAQLSPLLEPGPAREDNERALWQLLNEAPLEALRMRMPPAPDEFGGWQELAFLVRTHRLSPAELAQALAQWQQRYPDHPAIDDLVPELLATSEEILRAPDHVAVLLPLTGALAAPAQAVLDGFLAAYYAADTRPQLRVYDIGDAGRDVFSAYREAVDAGASAVVGPLAKESLIALANGAQLSVPLLALNALPDNQLPPQGLFQFALAPEDEAAAAARYALARGQNTAVVLVPRGDWGARVAQAFTRAFEAAGGQVLETALYDADTTDFSDPIQSMLNLDASERRFRQLRSNLRRDIKFEPYRRRDADLVFIGATPREARLIRPQLRFFHAIDLPVLATSHAYSGTPSSADQDLSGVEFVDMPWLLRSNADAELSRQTLEQAQPSAARFPRLYAFGIDAFRLLPYLHALRQAPGQTIDGVSGALSVDADGRVHRRLLVAQFVGGRVSREGLPQQAFGPLPGDEPFTPPARR